MLGMGTMDGRAVDGEAHLLQSITDILTTPKGSRVMRRAYGSDVPALLDAPLNAQTTLDFTAAVAAALDAWEPRVRLRRVRILRVTDDTVELELSGDWVDRAADPGATLDGARLQAGAQEVAL